MKSPWVVHQKESQLIPWRVLPVSCRRCWQLCHFNPKKNTKDICSIWQQRATESMHSVISKRKKGVCKTVMWEGCGLRCINCSLQIILASFIYIYICLYSHTPDSQTYILCIYAISMSIVTIPLETLTATLDGASFSRATIPESSIFGLPNVCRLRQHLVSHKGPPRKDAQIQFSKGFMYHRWCRIFFTTINTP